MGVAYGRCNAVWPESSAAARARSTWGARRLVAWLLVSALADDASAEELLDEGPASAPVSAKATAVPPTMAAPMPRVTAPAPSQA